MCFVLTRLLDWRGCEQAICVSGCHHRWTVLLIFLLSAQYSCFESKGWWPKWQDKFMLGHRKHGFIWEGHWGGCAGLEWSPPSAAAAVFIKQTTLILKLLNVIWLIWLSINNTYSCMLSTILILNVTHFPWTYFMIYHSGTNRQLLWHIFFWAADARPAAT